MRPGFRSRPCRARCAARPFGLRPSRAHSMKPMPTRWPAPASKVVGIAVGPGELESCRRFARGLDEVVRGMSEPPLLLISSDMNHFANDADTRRLDSLAIAALERGDPAQLHDTVPRNNI